MAKQAISADEARWRAEDDARTLRNFSELMSDKKRLNAASKRLNEDKKNIDRALSTTGKGSKTTKGGKR